MGRKACHAMPRLLGLPPWCRMCVGRVAWVVPWVSAYWVGVDLSGSDLPLGGVVGGSGPGPGPGPWAHGPTWAQGPLGPGPTFYIIYIKYYINLYIYIIFYIFYILYYIFYYILYYILYSWA